MRNPLALKSNLLNELMTPWGDFDKLFDGFLAPTVTKAQSFTNVEETQNHYLLSIDMPGVNKEDIKIELKDGSLLVQGERKYKKNNSEESYYYQNSFFLGNERFDAKDIEAKFENGVLNLTVAKSEKSKPQLIAVK
ncbi:MAG: Hsp20/alpha crystallin family protein [Oligoflexia bacterium]|nr:Hsp20/alpha crystallin family protein [Oligoflexia bacterium]